MPGRISRKKNGRYRVRWGRRTVAKNTTRAKAKRQLRLLRAVKHGWKPSSKRRKGRK